MGFRFYSIIILLTIGLSLPRFAHHTPDSKYYINVAKYFRGDLPREQLRGPFIYRFLTPLLAATLPSGNLDLNFALINVLATILAYLIFIPYLRRFVPTRTELNVGMLMLIVSFPTFNYASGVLSDPVGFLTFIVATYLLLNERYVLFSCAVCLGILARESILFLVLASIVYVVMGSLGQREKNWTRTFGILAVVSIPPVLVYFGEIAYFADIPNPSYSDVLSLRRFLAKITRTIDWITSLLALGPPSLLCLIGLRSDGLRFVSNPPDREARLLFSLTVVGLIHVIHAIATGISGRYVWPYYSVLIPLAVLSSRKTPLFVKVLGPVSDRILGASKHAGHLGPCPS